MYWSIIRLAGRGCRSSRNRAQRWLNRPRWRPGRGRSRATAGRRGAVGPGGGLGAVRGPEPVDRRGEAGPVVGAGGGPRPLAEPDADHVEQPVPLAAAAVVQSRQRRTPGPARGGRRRGRRTGRAIPSSRHRRSSSGWSRRSRPWSGRGLGVEFGSTSGGLGRGDQGVEAPAIVPELPIGAERPVSARTSAGRPPQGMVGGLARDCGDAATAEVGQVAIGSRDPRAGDDPGGEQGPADRVGPPPGSTPGAERVGQALAEQRRTDREHRESAAGAVRAATRGRPGRSRSRWPPRAWGPPSRRRRRPASPRQTADSWAG